ncbi:hypothetical protein ASD90_01450 [Terrabacter sp. Root181]|nr:hypothetical protein ASD90_01450 [Terrabacter sp. Root181]
MHHVRVNSVELRTRNSSSIPSSTDVPSFMLMAGWLRASIFNSDHGVWYTCKDFAAVCTPFEVTLTLGSVDSGDNGRRETLARETAFR